ncbi:restriction endonuclease subunit S [Streptococcus suis]
MSEWKKYKLSEIYTMSSGISSSKSQAGQGSPFLSFSTVFNNYFIPENLKDLMLTTKEEQARFSIIEGDVFLTRTSETLDELALSSVALNNYPFATYSGFLKRLRPKNKIKVYPKFIAFYLRSSYFRKTIINHTTMTLRASFNESMFSYLEVYLPDYDEQVRIGDFLYKLNQKITLNNQINEELEAMAKTLYDYWFVQFDFPDENGKPYKSSGGKMVYNDQLKREIPEGWGVKQLGELDIATGKRDANFGTENGQYDFWTTANEPIKADEYSFEGKAILIAGNGNFYINFTEGKFEAYQRTYVIQSADENELLFMYPACLQSIEKLRKGSNGSIIKYITIGDVQNISQPHCPVIANMFVDIFRPIINTIQKNKQQNQELTQLRDWLLPMLMNGQVKVEE